ncbi:MAG: YeeE/YedE family protein [Alphaproteobacteria bacterium]|nr:YeeE/YedE family protein [Alphaproteobacteria bacterium]
MANLQSEHVQGGGRIALLAGVNKPAVFVALGLLALGAGLLATQVSTQKAVLFVIGAGLGFALLHGAFGFTSGWRTIVTRGDGRGLKAQLAVIAATMICFVPMIAGYLPGEAKYGGLIAPVSLTVVIGAFMFGIGMQLGNGCGSGTLFTLGGGSKRMLFTLPGFIAGSLLASLQWSWWQLPGIGAVNLASEFGVPGALLLGLAGLAAVWWLIVLFERAHRPDKGPPAGEPQAGARDGWMWRGPWSLIWAGAALVVLNVATMLVGGVPWAVTYGFALWGATAASLAGFDIGAYEFWGWAKSSDILMGALVTNQQSVMNVGLILGAMLAAGLAGTFGKGPWPNAVSIAGAILGGLLMGYGARLSFGCNIGAFLGGIASGSLHGWVWFAAAFAGSLIGIKLRPVFGLAN